MRMCDVVAFIRDRPRFLLRQAARDHTLRPVQPYFARTEGDACGAILGLSPSVRHLTTYLISGCPWLSAVDQTNEHLRAAASEIDCQSGTVEKGLLCQPEKCSA